MVLDSTRQKVRNITGHFVGKVQNFKKHCEVSIDVSIVKSAKVKLPYILNETPEGINSDVAN